jgi:acid phosphatase
MKPSANWVVPCVLGVVVGWWLCATTGQSTRAGLEPPAAVNPQEKTLDANLYVQTAAEYRACCLQTYQCAGDRLELLLKSPWPRGLKPAVIMDLDETVLDNARFQTFLDKERLEYKDALWDVWEKDYPDEVGLVPGAKAFIERAEKLGATVAYISNRSEKFRDSTKRALELNKLNVADLDARLFLKTESSDKSARRERVMAKYRVLLLLGDNLRDFSEVFVVPKLKPDEDEKQRAEIAARWQKVDEAAGHWGVDWFILPNPVYGEWQKLYGAQPRNKLRQPKMKAPVP